MNDELSSEPVDPSSEGLFRFFSSQADVMLSQYNNINKLLGPTHDWTHPGTHCEVLLRDFLRRSLPNRFSVDKGYIFGRAQRDGGTVHCPEIDILIHDTHSFRPIYRLEDFVIVQPEAVKGLIQVKRSLSGGKKGTLNRGIGNVVAAKQHLIDTLRTNAKIRDPDAGFFFPSRAIFSAVIGFEENLRQKNPYSRLLAERRKYHQRYRHETEQDASIFVLPQFVGSLTGRFAAGTDGTHLSRKWFVFKSTHKGDNVALQYFLWQLTHTLLRQDFFVNDDTFPPFAFPNELDRVDEFEFNYQDDCTTANDGAAVKKPKS